MRKFWHGLWRDEHGNILVLFTVMAFVLIGMVGLALDGQRYFALSNEMQDLADASALAGARELDGSANAIARATTAAQSLLNNNPKWAEAGATGIQISAVAFYAGPDPNENATADDKYAIFIKVTTVNRGVLPTLIRTVGAGGTNMTSATATAGINFVACNTQPMMLCNPMEPNAFTATPGQMFHFKPKGSGGSNDFAPGDFGLLDPTGTTSSGSPDVQALLSQQSPAACYANQINPRPGQDVNAVRNGINTRFDHRITGNTSGMDLSPAPNVIDGVSTVLQGGGSGSCNETDLAGVGRMPRDATMTGWSGVDIGDGPTLTDLQNYWDYHYSSAMPALSANTRYEVYRKELNLDGDGAPAKRAGTESAVPLCRPTPSTSGYKRRIISVALVDCQHWAVRGNAVNNIRATKYADFFITESTPTDGSIYTEFVQHVTPESNSNIHRIIQLYK